jgi:hypothetical protein
MKTPKTSAREATGLWRNLGGYEIIHRREAFCEQLEMTLPTGSRNCLLARDCGASDVM